MSRRTVLIAFFFDCVVFFFLSSIPWGGGGEAVVYLRKGQDIGIHWAGRIRMPGTNILSRQFAPVYTNVLCYELIIV